jgi:hypothetical protein
MDADMINGEEEEPWDVFFDRNIARDRDGDGGAPDWQNDGMFDRALPVADGRYSWLESRA